MDELYTAHFIDLAVITYHAWWPSPGTDPFYLDNITENRGRILLYGSDYTPHYRMDGIVDGGSSPDSWAAQLASRLTVDSPLTIDLAATPSSGNWDVQATITNVGSSAINGYYRLAVTESDIVTPPQYNGETLHNHVMRDMVDDATGVLVSLNPTESTVIHKTVVMNPAWVFGVNPDNVQVVAFVQNSGVPREIYQGARLFYPFDQPYLVVGNVGSTEMTAGDGDGLLDPGETGEIVVTLKNINSGGATGVSATLTTSDPYFTVTEGTASYPDIPGFGSAANGSDPFVVIASPSTPSGYEGALQLDVTAAGGYSATLDVPVGVGSPTDHIGPDAGGYYAYEDTDLGYDETPVYNWVEINGVGTQIIEADEGRRTLTLPFTFKYYGVDYTQVTICSNGWMSMGFPVPGTFPGPRPIPDSGGPQAMIAGAWCDLDPSATGSGNVYWYSDVANHRYIVEFDGVEHYSALGDGDPETFQYILLDPAYYPTSTGEGEILLQYKSVTHPELMAVGIEDDSRTIGIEYSYLGTNNPAAAGLVNHRVIKYTPDAPVATSVPGVGPVAGGPVTLMAASPNPFAQSTALRFRLPVAQDAALRVYTVEGRLVRTLVQGNLPAGWHEASWNGLDESGRSMSSGIYFARLTVGGKTMVGKLLLTR